MEPTEFVRSEAGDPCAYKMKLGGCIAGPIGQGNSGKETMTCNRIAVKEINSSNLPNHHFQIKTEVKDVGIEEMFKKMYNQDFCEDKLVTLDQSIDEAAIQLFLGRQEISELNEHNNKNGFWSL